MSDVDLTTPPWLDEDADPRAGEDVVLRDERMWTVDAGTVELFAVETADDRPAARWTALATLEAPALLAGVEAGAERALMVRPSPDAELRAVDGDVAPEAAEAYLQQLLGALRSCRDAVHPLRRPTPGRRAAFAMVDLARDGCTAIDAGGMARLEDGVGWISVEEGQVRVLGRERNRALCAGELAPLGDGDWLLAESAAQVRVYDTREIVDAGALGPGVAAFGRELLEIAQRRVAAAEDRERRLLEERAEQDERAIDIAVQDFAAVLDARVARLRQIGDSAALAAARLVGAHLGVPVRGPAASAAAAARTDVVSAIAHASRLRSRSIELTGRWWRRDLGPLIGFLGDDETPVALIPRRRHYVLHDPESGTVERVRRRNAGRLGPEAREFYKPLPDQAPSRGELARYGIAGSRGDVATLALTAIGYAVVGLLVPILTGYILGTLVPHAERTTIAQLCGLLMLSASVSTLFATAFNLSGLRLEGRLDRNFQAGIWDRLLALPPRFFRAYSTGALATATLGISEAREALAGMGFKALLAAVVALTNFALIAVLSVPLALLTLAAMAVSVAVTVLIARRQMRHQIRAYDASQQTNSRTYQIIGGVAKVNTAAAETRALAHWAESFARGRRHTFAARAWQNGLAAFNAAYTLIAAAAAYFLIGRWMPDISRSTFLVFNVAFFQVLASLLQVSSVAVLGIQAVPSLRALRPILQAEPEARRGHVDPGPLSGRIELHNATFSYADTAQPAVQDVSLTIQKGEFVAIVGPSGCGKSTLLRLILAFERPQHGAVTFDGQDLLELDPVAVRRQCGVVLQDATLFAGDILSNIIGSGLYTYDDAWHALELCGMDEDVAAMPMGIYTMLSDGGGTLSGGQRQRLLIARALVARPPMLFLDEATSALDNRSQEVVTESMARLNATRVVIAHRLSTIRGADRIVVLDAGRIVQEGTYDELMEEDGLFRKLAARQLA